VIFAFNVHSGEWETISENNLEPTMDHRGLMVTHRGLVIVAAWKKASR